MERETDGRDIVSSMEGGNNGEAMPGEAEEDGRKKNRRESDAGRGRKRRRKWFSEKTKFFLLSLKLGIYNAVPLSSSLSLSLSQSAI